MRFSSSAWVGTWGAAAVLILGSVTDCIAQASVETESSLDEELNSFLAELEREDFTDDPFAQGRVPDLTIISSGDVRGEVAPCG